MIKNCIPGKRLGAPRKNFPENIYIQIGSFDHPEDLPPDRHTWASERIAWQEITDDLVQYDQLSNDGLPDNTPPYRRPVK